LKKRFPFSHVLFCLLAAAALFNGCSRKRIVELKKEKLFTIPIGKGLEEIGVNRGKNGQFSGPTTVLFKNGFFYIVDHVNQKVLKVTTPGDIILTLSKGESAVEPDDETVLRLKERKSYPFNLIGKIAVDSENNVYIEDKILNTGPEKTEIDVFDSSSGAGEGGEEMYVSHILKFDRLGRYVTKIGKGGPDSEPFFYVYKMDVDNEGNLIVLTGEGEWREWTYYKFDPDGNLLFYQVIESEQIFSVKDMEKVGFFILDLFPVRNSNSIVFWVSLYDTSYDTQNVNKEEEIWGEEIEIENSDSVKGSRKGTGKKLQRDENHLLRGCHLEVETCGHRFAQSPHVGVLDVPSVMPEVHRDAVGTRKFCHQRSCDGVRFRRLAGLPDGGYVVHINSQLGHVGLPGSCEVMRPPFLNANAAIVHTCESEVCPAC